MTIGITGLGICAITGPEGSGKSSLMTGLCVQHAALGGKLQTFPGYVVYDKDGAKLDENGDAHGNPICEEIAIEKWVTIPKDLKNAVIAIDEIQNFFSSHLWQSRIVDLFAAVMGQRRKRNLNIVYTTQDIYEIPRILRDKTHYEIKCWDMFWSNPTLERKVQRGKLIRTSIVDRKGFRTGYPMTEMPGNFFHPERIYHRYDTNAVIDIWHKFTKVKIKAPEYTLDLRGGQTEEAQSEELAESFKHNNGEKMTRAEKMAVIDKYLAMGKTGIEVRNILNALDNQ